MISHESYFFGVPTNREVPETMEAFGLPRPRQGGALYHHYPAKLFQKLTGVATDPSALWQGISNRAAISLGMS